MTENCCLRKAACFALQFIILLRSSDGIDWGFILLLYGILVYWFSLRGPYSNFTSPFLIFFLLNFNQIFKMERIYLFIGKNLFIYFTREILLVFPLVFLVWRNFFRYDLFLLS